MATSCIGHRKKKKTRKYCTRSPRVTSLKYAALTIGFYYTARIDRNNEGSARREGIADTFFRPITKARTSRVCLPPGGRGDEAAGDRHRGESGTIDPVDSKSDSRIIRIIRSPGDARGTRSRLRKNQCAKRRCSIQLVGRSAGWPAPCSFSTLRASLVLSLFLSFPTLLPRVVPLSLLSPLTFGIHVLNP